MDPQSLIREKQFAFRIFNLSTPNSPAVPQILPSFSKEQAIGERC
jgi:hypothetical protein